MPSEFKWHDYMSFYAARLRLVPRLHKMLIHQPTHP